MARPLNDNIAALSNMIEAAAGHSDLAGIRSRGRLSRPFTRVADMLAASQERYREKEGELLGRISRVEDNIQKALQLSGAHTLDQLPDVIQGQVAELRRALLPFRRELRTLRQSMREDVHLLELAGYTVTTEVRFDSHPAEAIARYVQNHDINMIAMTTHGRTGLTRLVFGSVAQYLMTHLDVPIMIVRPNANFGEMEE